MASIAYYRNDETGHLDTPHQLGTTEDGRPLYQSVEGYTPVDSEGEEYPVACDEDGNWIPCDDATLERVIRAAMASAAAFVDEFGVAFDPETGGDWDSTAWSAVRTELDLGEYETGATWRIYRRTFVAETERLADAD